ncbi:hypothetical protein C9374_004225 [Naegleria lovaniensis]|uniref:non-specific serine/threonine protein kinase n=1 Tax=Naegleria lovaniensis TaxID=51637 RepID=A0AA88KJ46_NAELO|nr:uncharacterized protein C9374_004225 [Naegleria lovaniensis]KAG2383554.1 hypothetical protein C9374_004225 [Naegleria lovaniensis]
MELNPMEKPDFSGYLKKKGGNIKTYKRRWFELRGKLLFYFKKQGDKKPTGFINISGAKVEVDETKPISFKLRGKNLARVYEISAENEFDFNSWLKELNKAINYNPTQDKEGLEEVKDEIRNAKSQEQVTVSGKASSGKKVTLSDFELLTVVGRGSFGKVMKVREKGTSKVLAMKVLRKDMIVKENMVSHTLAEKKILQSIDHPFIVALHYAFQTEEKLYLVLDYLPGGELFFHLREETKFDVERAKFYAAQIVLAIEHLHKNDIIYRDLKPENVVLDADGYAVLTDFGLAKTSIGNNTPTYTFCGTPEYLAPEILKGQGHGKAVDWWSLGILLYEMIVGLPPFYSENINEMYELILKAPLKFPGTVDAQAQSLLKGLLERDEHKRLGGGRKMELKFETIHSSRTLIGISSITNKSRLLSNHN